MSTNSSGDSYGSFDVRDYDPEPILNLDPYLRPHLPAIASRTRLLKFWRRKIAKYEGGMDKFTRGYERFGFNVAPNGDVVYREWAPNAVTANLIGEFSAYMHSRHATPQLPQMHGIAQPIR